ncbi:hypothetical protein TD95_004675, partial [Thielaviopsis punctulata]
MLPSHNRNHSRNRNRNRNSALEAAGVARSLLGHAHNFDSSSSNPVSSSPRYRLSSSLHDRYRNRAGSDSTPAAVSTIQPDGSAVQPQHPDTAVRPRQKLVHHMKMRKTPASKNNNPYPQSARLAELLRHRPGGTHSSLPSVFSTSPSAARSSSSFESSFIELDSSNGVPIIPLPSRASTIGGNTYADADNASVNASIISSSGSIGQPSTLTGGGTRSIAATVMTDHDTARSITATSAFTTATARTLGGTERSIFRADSTFSSPAPSVQSLATTLTTIQSLAASTVHPPHHHHSHNHHNNHISHTTITFNQPFPTASPASAIPPHLAPNTPGHPTTYASATANNLLTDNASILTLASSSKRRRRRSFDTDASVRALAPSSLWGGSRESLPLSVLSANIENAGTATSMPAMPSIAPTVSATNPSALGASSAAAGERASVYSMALGTGDRSSVYTSITGTAPKGDGASVRSVRSGLYGHARADSVNGSIAGGLTTTPLASPVEEVSMENLTLSGNVYGEEDEDGGSSSSNGTATAAVTSTRGSRSMYGSKSKGKEVERHVVYN